MFPAEDRPSLPFLPSAWAGRDTCPWQSRSATHLAARGTPHNFPCRSSPRPRKRLHRRRPEPTSVFLYPSAHASPCAPAFSQTAWEALPSPPERFPKRNKNRRIPETRSIPESAQSEIYACPFSLTFQLDNHTNPNG